MCVKYIIPKESGLWREFARIIGEVRPCRVLVENSPMLTVRGLGTVLGDLAALGYDARWGVLSAADAIWFECLSRDDIPALDHLRERIWIVATLHDSMQRRHGSPESQVRPGGNTADNADSDPTRLESLGRRCERQPVEQGEGPTGRVRTGGVDEAAPDSNAIGRDGRPRLQRERRRIELEDGDTSPDAALGRLAMRWWRYEDADSDAMRGLQREGGERNQREWVGDSSETGTNGERERWEGISEGGTTPEAVDGPGNGNYPGWWATEPAVGRLVHGLPDRVDRCKACSNAQVPAVVRLAWETLKEEQEQP